MAGLKRRWAVAAFVLAAIAAMVAAVCVGSVKISVSDVPVTLFCHIFGQPLPERVTPTVDTIIWTLRVPRALLAFTVGASLGVSGAVMQAVLRNPLASTYTIGVSAGASLGVGTLMLLNISFPILGLYGYPIVGCVCGMIATTLAVSFASAVDRDLSGNTIVLVGMVFSLFITAMISLITALNTKVLERLTHWQMGSFAMREWPHVSAILPVVCLLAVVVFLRSRELDILTFGDEQAELIGVNTKREKWLLLYIGAALTGASVAFVGIIGFVDLVAPHIARRVFGAKHSVILPMAGVCGGALMVAADLVARTALASAELPVGVVTALIGAPFFGFVFFSKRRVS